uniref:Uncharacterized protein n=4 Tax=Lotharella globosa TaxID=91324 RepID=A0A7S3YHW7_9EUKA|mmetsp:Transcript_4119/g.8220  ORF Transcript_4119/g.8220 Transcript_4119/m.8220 type:complete len:496 (+) Transcript_4119:73-1560(+)
MGNGSPSKHVANCGKYLNLLLDSKTTAQEKEKAAKELEDALREMNRLLYGNVTTDTPGDRKTIGKLIVAIRSSDLTERLVLNIQRLGFETPKLTARIVQFFLRDQGSSYDAIKYFKNRPQLIPHLINSFTTSHVTIPVSDILKEALMYPEILGMMLERTETQGDKVIDAPDLWKIMEYMKSTDFGTAAEAFAILDVIVNCREDISAETDNERKEKGKRGHVLSEDKQREHKALFKRWLQNENETQFWSELHSFLRTEESPATKIRVLNFLYTMLKSPDYFHVAMRYATVPEHLKLMMRLLDAKNCRIQVVAYNVFKIFFACAFPDPPKGIAEILFPNKKKIVDFLEALKESTKDRNGEMQDEVDLINSQLRKLPKSTSKVVSGSPMDKKNQSPAVPANSSANVHSASANDDAKRTPKEAPKLRLTLSELSLSESNQGENEDEEVPSVVSRTAIVLQPSERDEEFGRGMQPGGGITTPSPRAAQQSEARTSVKRTA